MLSEKKFSRECVRVCVKETRLMKNIEADMQVVFDNVWRWRLLLLADKSD